MSTPIHPTAATVTPGASDVPPVGGVGVTGGAGDPGACQRWHDRRPSWRHVRDGGFDRHRYQVAPIDEADAKRFIQRHHYAGTMPAALRRYGMLERDTQHLVGVAVFAVPVNTTVLTRPFPALEPHRQSMELSRFCLLDQVPGNGESWFLGQAFRLLHADGVRGIVSFSDPVPRWHLDGTVIMPGHVGIIYQATGAVYAGRGTARTLLLLPDGTSLNARSLQKVRALDQGHAYVERRLVAAGAPARPPTADPAVWLADALRAARVRRVRHGGAHRYLFRLGSARERRTIRIGLPSVDTYPKLPDT